MNPAAVHHTEKNIMMIWSNLKPRRVYIFRLMYSNHLIDLAVSRILRYWRMSGKELSLKILRHLKPIQTLPRMRDTKEGGMVKKSMRV